MVVALAARWPDDRTLLVVEADPAGGDLAARLGLDRQPGLMALAADGRRELTPEMVWKQTQPLAGAASAQVLTGPVSAEQAGAALSALGSRFARLMAELDGVDVLADCGRLDPASPATPLVRAADLVIVVARPSAPQLQHLAALVTSLGSGVPVALVLVGDRPYGVVEAGRAVGAEPLGTIAHDARAADLLAGASGSPRLLRVSALLRTARTAAEALATRMGPPGVAALVPGAADPLPVADAVAPDPAPVAGAVAPDPAPVAHWVAPDPAPVAGAVAPDPEPMADAAAAAPPPTGRRRRPPRARPLQARPHPADPTRPATGAVPPSLEVPDEPS